MDIDHTGAQNAVRQTLLDQMQSTDYEISQRKKLFSIDNDTESRLFSLYPSVKRDLESIILEFNEQQNTRDHNDL